MPVIDADAHIIETEATWRYMEGDAAQYRPGCVNTGPGGELLPDSRWQLSVMSEPRMVGNDEMTGTTAATRELLDVPARIRHMDAVGVDVHVLYPTVLLQGVTDNAAEELALRRSYNRWLAERCEGTNGRLRWVCAPPLHSIEAAIEELRYAKAHGACGVLKKADPEAGRWPNDPWFFPVYEEAERLGMPICFHTGTGIPSRVAPGEWLYGRLQRLTLPVASALHSMLLFDIPGRFPTLRFAFVEAGAGWLPFIVGNLKRRAEKISSGNALSFRDIRLADDILKTNRIYVTCFPDEDLPYLVRAFGADNLIAGSDYGHADPARENGFVERLTKRAEAGDYPMEVVEKILWRNPKTLYGL